MVLPADRIPPELWRSLLDRTHRATLHRLRGITQVLAGWATFGGPPEDAADDVIRVRVREAGLLSDRLAVLWQDAAQATGSLLASTAPSAPALDGPRALLAAALRIGTPEEREVAPPDLSGEAAVATALWVEAAAGEAASLSVSWTARDDGGWQLRLRAAEFASVPASVRAALGDWVTEEAADDAGPAGGLVLRIRDPRTALHAR